MTVALACAGCATQEDFQRAVTHLRGELTTLQKGVAENHESIRSSRKIQADIGADLVDLRNSVQKLRGATERLDVKISALGSKTEDPHSSLNDISKRLTYLENYLGMGKSETRESKTEKVIPPQKGKPVGKEEAYANAYSVFTSGRYDAAKDDFRTFLKAFPNSEYSDNAQFWIGECEYFQGRYEEAIIEYEAVIQNYPTGNKVPNALLKQALSFLKLGDTSSAKLLLQGVIKDYPNTTPASVARKKLVDIK